MKLALTQRGAKNNVSLYSITASIPCSVHTVHFQSLEVHSPIVVLYQHDLMRNPTEWRSTCVQTWAKPWQRDSMISPKIRPSRLLGGLQRYYGQVKEVREEEFILDVEVDSVSVGVWVETAG